MWIASSTLVAFSQGTSLLVTVGAGVAGTAITTLGLIYTSKFKASEAPAAKAAKAAAAAGESRVPLPQAALQLSKDDLVTVYTLVDDQAELRTYWEQRKTEVDDRFSAMEARGVRRDGRLDDLEGQVNRQGNRLDQVERRADRANQRLDGLEGSGTP